ATRKLRLPRVITISVMWIPASILVPPRVPATLVPSASSGSPFIPGSRRTEAIPAVVFNRRDYDGKKGATGHMSRLSKPSCASLGSKGACLILVRCPLDQSLGPLHRRTTGGGGVGR